MFKGVESFERSKNIFIGVSALSISIITLSSNSKAANSAECSVVKPY